MKKITVILFLIAAMCLKISALNSAAYDGSAHTVEDEAYYLMNVLDWSSLKFDKTYVFSNLNSTSSGNLAAFFHTKNKNVIGLGWEGNLWSETSYNSVTAFYGWNKFALALNYTGYISPAWYLDGNVCNDYKNLGGNAEFGAIVNKNFALSFSLGFSNTSGAINTAEIDYSTFTANTDLVYSLKNDNNLNAKLFLDYTGSFATRKSKIGNNETKAKYSQNIIVPGTKLLYHLNNNLAYGLYAAVPVTITSGDNIPTDTSLEFTVSNGICYAIKPNQIFFNTGIELVLPSITFHKDADTERGLFYSTFYAGFSFILANRICIDLSTGINPNNGVKLDDIWNQSFSISVSAKF